MRPVLCNHRDICFALLLLTSVSSVAEKTGCSAPTVIEGETARLEFHLRVNVDSPFVSFYAHLVRKKDQDLDILHCRRSESSTNIQCTIKLEGYTNVEVDGSSLKVSIPRVTLDNADTYLLRVYVNDEPQSPISCSLTVKAKRDNNSLLIIVASTVGGCVLIAAVAACLCIRRKRRNKHYSVPPEEKYNLEDRSDPQKEHEETSQSLLHDTAEETSKTRRLTEELEPEESIQHCTARVHDDMRPQPPGRRREGEQSRPSSPGNHTVRVDDALNRQPWYHGGTSQTKAQEMLNSAPTENGLFLVTDSGIDNEFRLKAKFSSGLRTYYIRPGGSGYFIEEGVSFPSVPALIKYYKHHQGPFPALLSLPCKR